MRQKLLIGFTLLSLLPVGMLAGCQTGDSAATPTESASSNSKSPHGGPGQPGENVDAGNGANTAFKANGNSANANGVKHDAANAVCPDPKAPCDNKDKKFDDWELSFKLPAKLQRSKNYSSAPFYGVILKTYEEVEDCDGESFIAAAEKDRKAEQAKTPDRKFFASYGCANMDAVIYDFEGRLDAKKETVVIDDFIAVYAGATKEEGEDMLKKMKAQYPKAMLKQMTAIYETGE